MDVEVLKAERREGRGRSAAQKLRRAGKVPAVLYGHGEEVVSLTVSAVGVHEFLASGHHRVGLEYNDISGPAAVRLAWEVLAPPHRVYLTLILKAHP